MSLRFVREREKFTRSTRYKHYCGINHLSRRVPTANSELWEVKECGNFDCEAFDADSHWAFGLCRKSCRVCVGVRVEIHLVRMPTLKPWEERVTND